ncbi:MAG: hypothetical protein QM703_30020 [Gemmatales bacterium]
MSPIVLAAVMTLLNAVKPLYMDDSFYLTMARQVSEHAIDPYGHSMYWVQVPERSIDILCPPVIPYWWGLGIRLFGFDPFFNKVWLFPFALMYAFSLHLLGNRFVPGRARR